MLKTRNRERILTEACFEAEQNFVVDNRNPTDESRKRYINGAKKAGFKVIVYYFDIEYHAALKRNNSRSGTEKVPEVGLLSTKRRLEKPEFHEGIDEIFTIVTENNNTYIIKSDK